MAAVRIALDNGLDAATVEAISEAADISPRTFFNYFASKDEALVMEPAFTPEDLVEALSARPRDEPIMTSFRAIMKDLATGFRLMFEGMGPMQELHRRHPELALKAGVADQRRLLEMVLDTVKERAGHDGLRARLIVVASFGAVFSAVQESMAEREGPALEALVDRAFDLIEQGL